MHLQILVLALIAFACLAPRPSRAAVWPAATAVVSDAARPHLAADGYGLPVDVPAAASTAPPEITGAGWWGERKKRFQEVAVCALSSANVTYLLLTGISGPGAVIGFSVSLLGVIVCL